MSTPHNTIRLILVLLLCLGGNTAMGQRADSVVTINAIHYHPALSLTHLTLPTIYPV